MDVIYGADFVEESFILLGDIAMVATEGGFEIFSFAVKIMVAETETDRGNSCKMSEPSDEAGALEVRINAVEIIDEIAGDSDNCRLASLGFFENLGKILGGFVAKMDIADSEDFVFFLIGPIEAISRMIEKFHVFKL